MKNKLPKVFQNQINQPVHNNLDIYYSKENSSNSISNEDRRVGVQDINQKIESIFSSPTYVYKADVEIQLKDGTSIVRKLIGMRQGQLLTMDNELIPITNMKDINLKK